MKIALLLAAFLLTGLQARAQDDACEFVDRRKVAEALTELPDEVIGYLDCDKLDGELNVIRVARLPDSGEKTINGYFHRLERILRISVLETKVVESRRSADGRHWIEYKSIRELGNTTHFLFTAKSESGKSFAFTFTDNELRAPRFKRAVMKVRNEFVTPALLGKLSKRLV